MSSQPLSASAPGIGLQPQRLLIVRLSAMGDVIHTLPAATALRQAFPECVIGWVIDERWSELLCSKSVSRRGSRSPGRPLADQVHTLKMKDWRHAMFSRRMWKEISNARHDLCAERYEVAIDFQGAIRSAMVAHLSGAPVIYGFAQPRENIATMFYTKKVLARGTHIIEQNLSLAAAVTGRALPLAPAELPYDKAAERECERQLQELRITDYGIINPGAGWGAKQWPAALYGEVAHGLASETGLRTLINFGPGEENLARAAESASRGAAKAFTCSVSELVAFTRRARIFLGGDTGPLHLAAALGVPVVAIFGPTNPARNGPFATRSVVLRDPASPTSHSRRQQPDRAMLEISPTEVLEAALSLLREGRD